MMADVGGWPTLFWIILTPGVPRPCRVLCDRAGVLTSIPCLVLDKRTRIMFAVGRAAGFPRVIRSLVHSADTIRTGGAPLLAVFEKRVSAPLADWILSRRRSKLQLPENKKGPRSRTPRDLGHQSRKIVQNIVIPFPEDKR